MTDDVWVTLAAPHPAAPTDRDPAPADAVVALSHVDRFFGENPALRDFNLQVPKSNITVLLDPDLLLFDEPTSGLDPESSYAVLEMIREMTASGATVVMCTHLLLEAEGLADQVVVLEEGHDLIAGTPFELTQRYWPGAVV